MTIRHRSLPAIALSIGLLVGMRHGALGVQGTMGAAGMQAPRIMPDTLIVRFRSKTGATARRAAHGAMRGTRLRSFKLIPADVVRIPAGSDADAIAASYAARPEVAYVQRNFAYTAEATPDDAKFTQQWALSNTGQGGGLPGADIDAVSAWDREQGDSSVIVAVIDTGIDYEHPDLVGNMWTNDAELTGVLGVDDDGNGVVDDIYGAKFTDGTGEPTSGDPFDDHFHGTHVAGIIGASGNNGLGIAGINHTVRLMAAKFLNSSGSGSTADAIAAIEYAVTMGAKITNNSWGGRDFDQALNEAIEAANQAGVLFVAAAGNYAQDNAVSPLYPAAYDAANIISVASTDRYDELSYFSNFGLTTVDIAAPGSEILSTVPNRRYEQYSGTSMAAPHVAGVAALLLARVPGLSVHEIKTLILDAADHIFGLAGFVPGGRRLNANRALEAAVPARGKVYFDREVYPCGQELTIRLRDLNLAGAGNVPVTVIGTSGDVESLILSETTTTSVFEGVLPTRTDGVVAPDGSLAAQDGDSVMVTYHDADDGSGMAATISAGASVDCTPPQISNVRVSAVTGRGATIEFDTDEPTTGRVSYGAACDQLAIVRGLFAETTAHEIMNRDLDSETHYFFSVEAIDPAGNVTTDDNGGLCYEFTTLFAQDYFTFDSTVGGDPYGLRGQTTTFSPDGSGHYYAACREPATAFPVDPSGGVPDPSPDGNLYRNTPYILDVPVADGQHVQLYGQSYDRFYVWRHGWITFDAPDDDEHFYIEEHFAQPRVTALGSFTLRSRSRGWASSKQLDDRVAITFQHLRTSPDRQSADVQVELFFDGRIRLTTLNVNTEIPFQVGLSEGHGLPADFESSDLPGAPRCSAPDPTAIPLHGRKLYLKYTTSGATNENRLSVDIADDAFALPVPGSAADPTINGANLVLFNPTTGERDSLYLPAAYWRQDGEKYLFGRVVDTGNNPLVLGEVPGPCDSVLLKAGRARIRCKGGEAHGFHFTLDEPDGQGELAAYLTLGAGPNIPRYCAVFGGAVKKDEASVRNSKARFFAKQAPPPAQCPPLP